VRLIVGVLVNLAAFILALLGVTWIAAALYAVSVVLLVWRREEKKVETRVEAKEPTPEEIKKRPVTAPEI
jgi:predicted membrane protein